MYLIRRTKSEVRRTKDAQRTMNNERGAMNKKSKLKVRPGFTLTELAVTMVITIVVMLAIGITLAGSVRGWQTAYGRAFSDVAMESYSARRAFDSIIRKACRQVLPNPFPPEGSDWVEVHYYSTYLSGFPDRYARFYLEDGKLKLDYGIIGAPRLGTTIVCSSVDSCVFNNGPGRSIEMLVKLNNGTQSATIVSSAVMHNPR